MKKTIDKKKGEAAKPLQFLEKKCPECGKKKLIKGRAAIQCENCGHTEPLIPNKKSVYKPDVIHNDASDFDGEEASTDQLKKITTAANQAVALEKQIADLNAAAAVLSADRDTILNKSLPALMDSAHMEDFTLTDEFKKPIAKIKIKDVVSGSLPSAEKKPNERKQALAWLSKNGGKGLIKTSYITEFGVGQEALAAKFEKLITSKGFAAKKATGVHAQTLCAFVRELLAEGQKVPIETLGIYVGRHAKIEFSDAAQAKAESERVKPKRNKS